MAPSPSSFPKSMGFLCAGPHPDPLPVGEGEGSSAARGGTGQANRERRPLADFALHFDPPLVMFNDVLADGQPKSGSLRFTGLGGALGRKKRLEDLGQQLFRNARAGVDHLNANLACIVSL